MLLPAETRKVAPEAGDIACLRNGLDTTDDVPLLETSYKIAKVTGPGTGLGDWAPAHAPAPSRLPRHFQRELSCQRLHCWQVAGGSETCLAFRHAVKGADTTSCVFVCVCVHERVLLSEDELCR